MKVQGKVGGGGGAGSGYGAGIARRFADEGAHVVCVDIDAAAAFRVARVLSSGTETALGLQCDVSDGAAVGAMIAETVRLLGGFDILVNNAGVTQKPARIARIAEADLHRMFAVNVKSLYHIAVH